MKKLKNIIDWVLLFGFFLIMALLFTFVLGCIFAIF